MELRPWAEAYWQRQRPWAGAHLLRAGPRAAEAAAVAEAAEAQTTMARPPVAAATIAQVHHGSRSVAIASAESLAAAVLSARTGIASHSPHEPGEGATTGRSLRLTTREREVLDLLASGTSTAAIGQRLRIARNTARAHVQRVIEKLGAHSKLEAVAVARRTGIISS